LGDFDTILEYSEIQSHSFELCDSFSLTSLVHAIRNLTQYEFMYSTHT